MCSDATSQYVSRREYNRGDYEDDDDRDSRRSRRRRGDDSHSRSFRVDRHPEDRLRRRYDTGSTSRIRSRDSAATERKPHREKPSNRRDVASPEPNVKVGRSP
jgi:hypothetical protein